MNTAFVAYADRLEACPGSEGRAAGAGAAQAAEGAQLALWTLCLGEPTERQAEAARELAGLYGAALIFAVSPAFWDEKSVSRTARGAAAALGALAFAERPDAVVLGSDLRSRALAPRLAARTGGPLVMSASGLSLAGGELIARCPTYNGGATASLSAELCGGCAVVSLAGGAFEGDTFPRKAAHIPPERTVHIGCAHPDPGADGARVEKYTAAEGLGGARRVVVCGHGMESCGGVAAAQGLADALGARLGGTRPCVIDSWLPHSELVGISGVFVKPELCVVCAASGAQAFAAGISDSGLIIGINNDGRAPLFRLCDVGIEADCAEFIPALLEELDRRGLRADKERE